MIKHAAMKDDELRKLIRQGKICLGGNKKLRIYGRLNCKSGKRMKKENRIFFTSEEEAVNNGYRSCRHCMRER